MSSIRSRFDRPSISFAPTPIASDSRTASAAGTAALDTALRLSAVLFLLRPMGTWLTVPAMLGLGILAVVSPRVLRAPATWLALAALTAVRIASDWPLADNHIYLQGYWCLAIVCALLTGNAATTLAASARWLVALSFALAVLWKALLSPDYLDGRFFRVTLLTDPRLTEIAMLAGGLNAAQVEHSRAAMAALPEGAEWLDPPEVAEPWQLRAFADAATWGVLALETLVALLFMMPAGSRARHASLLGFCAVTYAVAPVPGFGCLLAVLGLAQCDSRLVRSLYVGLFVLVIAYAEIPWPGFLVDQIG